MFHWRWHMVLGGPESLQTGGRTSPRLCWERAGCKAVFVVCMARAHPRLCTGTMPRCWSHLASQQGQADPASAAKGLASHGLICLWAKRNDVLHVPLPHYGQHIAAAEVLGFRQHFQLKWPFPVSAGKKRAHLVTWYSSSPPL